MIPTLDCVEDVQKAMSYSAEEGVWLVCYECSFVSDHRRAHASSLSFSLSASTSFESPCKKVREVLFALCIHKKLARKQNLLLLGIWLTVEEKKKKNYVRPFFYSYYVLISFQKEKKNIDITYTYTCVLNVLKCFKMCVLAGCYLYLSLIL